MAASNAFQFQQRWADSPSVRGLRLEKDEGSGLQQEVHATNCRMCTAYEIGKRGGSFPEWLVAEASAYLLGVETRIIRPTISAPVIMPDGSLREMLWGFRRPVPGGKTKQLWRTIVNSREDKLKGRTWCKAFQERRCLVPAGAFYEWTEGPGKSKVPLRFEDSLDRLLWIAGIWEHDQERGECFSMITTEPNGLVLPVHDRMPAVLTEDQYLPFLSGEIQELGPSAGSLRFAEAENFLKKEVAPPPQGELF